MFTFALWGQVWDGVLKDSPSLLNEARRHR